VQNRILKQTMSIQYCNELLAAIRPDLADGAGRVVSVPAPGDRFCVILSRRTREKKTQQIMLDRGYVEDWHNGIDALGNKHPSSLEIERDLRLAILYADSLPVEEGKTIWTVPELLRRIP